MSCNACAKSFSLIRKEKGCPGCGFSYCSKCLDNKLFLAKLNNESKVCGKCKKSATSELPPKIEPPDAYYKRLEKTHPLTNDAGSSNNSKLKNPATIDDEIQTRLKNLTKGCKEPPKSTEQEILDRLNKIKEDRPTASDAEIQERLARLRGVPVCVLQNPPVLPALELRTEQAQADDLIKQYIEQTQIDAQYKDEFDKVIDGMACRLQKLKGQDVDRKTPGASAEDQDEDEEELIKKVIEKYTTEALLEDVDNKAELGTTTTTQQNELPLREICNNDATLRCLGCRFLFCKRCFLEHKDDDYGCNRYEEYKGEYLDI